MTSRLFLHFGATALLASASVAFASSAASILQDTQPAPVAEPVAEPAAESPPAEVPSQDAADASGTPLPAFFMTVEGPVSWRPDDQSPFRPAQVDDLIPSGAEIRTQFRGRAAIRVGKNATILMDPLTTIVLPEILEDGQTLRTRVAIKAGRADFKVDKIGLDNDFQVRAGSATMAVKGTGGTFGYGGFSGASFAGASFNEINAIEVRYFSSLQQRVAISGGGRSSESNQNPVLAAYLASFGPPPSDGTGDSGLSETDPGMVTIINSDIQQQQAIVTGSQQPGNMALRAASGGPIGPGTPGFPAGGTGAGGGSAGGGTAGGGTGSGGVLGGGDNRPPGSIGGNDRSRP